MQEKSLLELAGAARMRAYAPYSGFAVGAALMTEAGAVFTGANIENLSFGNTVCAERVAIWSAVAAGYTRFSSLAVVADCSPPPLPCGACRQVLHELAGNINIITGNLQGEVLRHNLSRLFPEPFSCSIPAGPHQPKLENDGDSWKLPLILRPIGYVSNSFKERSDIPRNYREFNSRVIINPELEEGLYRLEEEKYVNIIAYLHRSSGFTLKEARSGRGGEVYGVFACRAPLRPNPISLTEVELLNVDGPVLTVRGLDLIDKTPVLDIKTVLPDDKKP